MREIKFRMWNNVADRPAASKYFYDTDNVFNCLMQQINFNNQTVPCHNHVGDGSVFQQFTGLKDKNGKEIYEGDIDKHCGTVMFGEWEYAFDSECPVEKFTGFYFSSGVPFPQQEMEIIGNIYENNQP